MMGWGYGYGNGYGMMGGWPWMMIIPIILIGVIIYAVIRLTSGNSNIQSVVQYDNSLRILNERFAKGEITEEEYNQRKSVLMK